MRLNAAILVAVLPLAWACASSGGGQTDQSAPRSSPNVITAEELANVSASNLFEAIRSLRPQWLDQSPPVTLMGRQDYTTVVYMDRIRFGTLDMLRQVPPRMPLSVRYYNASEAQSEFGVGNLLGAIQIVTRR